MIKNYKVITLCGSTRFKDEFMKVQKDLTLKETLLYQLVYLVIQVMMKSEKIWMKEHLLKQKKC